MRRIRRRAGNRAQRRIPGEGTSPVGSSASAELEAEAASSSAAAEVAAAASRAEVEASSPAGEAAPTEQGSLAEWPARLVAGVSATL